MEHSNEIIKYFSQEEIIDIVGFGSGAIFNLKIRDICISPLWILCKRTVCGLLYGMLTRFVRINIIPAKFVWIIPIAQILSAIYWFIRSNLFEEPPKKSSPRTRQY